jgi:hypothetical protein
MACLDHDSHAAPSSAKKDNSLLLNQLIASGEPIVIIDLLDFEE